MDSRLRGSDGVRTFYDTIFSSTWKKTNLIIERSLIGKSSPVPPPEVEGLYQYGLKVMRF
jgi:hypothetical protein